MTCFNSIGSTIKSDQRITVFGATGSGKTKFTKEQLWSQYTRRIFHDPKCENNDLLKNATLVTTPDELRWKLQKGYTSILYQPKTLDVDDFEGVCRIVYEFGNLALFCDEVGNYCTANTIPKWFNHLLVRGRSRGIAVISLSQRPRSCHGNVVSEANHMFIFRLMLESDLDKIKNFVPRAVAQEVPLLPEFHKIYASSGGVIKRLKPSK